MVSEGSLSERRRKRKLKVAEPTEEVEALEERVGGFGGVLEGTRAVTAGEGGGRHEGAVENIALIDLGVVE